VQAIIWGGSAHLSWWLYHGLYAVAFGVLFTGWAIEVKRAGTLRAIADALSMRDALAQLNRGLEAPILKLVDAVEAKDQETFGHVRRVSGSALAVGTRLSLSPSALRMLALSAEMHDVGKISIPSSILAKPGPLTADEYAVVQTHTRRGYEIAEQVKALRELSNVIRSHHERYDGTGYPDGLKGDAIPLFSRIICVADSYDAMTSKRPYRDGRPHAEAIAEIMAKRGQQFDPQCVDAFVSVFEEPGSRQADEAVAAYPSSVKPDSSGVAGGALAWALRQCVACHESSGESGS
jgi:HD-GYP domain-containing protein (c-di-GMP phosphodiesterase class II)